MLKKFIQVSQVFLTSSLMISCTTSQESLRNPSSAGDYQNLYLQKLETDLIKERINYLTAVKAATSKNANAEFDFPMPDANDERIAKLKQQLSSRNQDPPVPVIADQSLNLLGAPKFDRINRRWRKNHQTFLLHNLNRFKEPVVRRYEMSEAYETDLILKNQYHSWFNKTPVDRENSPQYFLKAEFSCEGKFKWNGKERSAGHVEKFHWHDTVQSQSKTYATLNPDSKDCTLRFDDLSKPLAATVTFKPSTDSVLEKVSGIYETCVHYDASELPGPEKFFYSAQNARLSCATPVGVFKSLPRAVQTMEAKMEALTGQPVPKAFWANDGSKLNTSKAPKYDAIFVSYLIFRDDFFGAMIGELLEIHASRGTHVYIMTAKVSNSEADSTMFLNMMAKYPNIHIQEYAYAKRDGLGMKDTINELHRVLHAKMFITYSKENPSLNRAWLGGRNLGDAYAFPKNDKGEFEYTNEKSYAVFNDYEAEIKDPHFINQLVAQYAALWNQDKESQYIRDSVLNVNSKQRLTVADLPVNNSAVRHIVGVPYADEMNLESFIVGLIDSAEKEVKIATPYLNPTKKITEAMFRATDRGVKVTVLTLLNLKGDTADFILGDVNQKSANSLINKVDIFAYRGGGIMHAKIIMVDKKLTFFGAVNLNKRSFYHDIENGALTLGTQFNTEVDEIFNKFMQGAVRIEKAEKITIWKRIFIKVFDKEF